MSSWTMTRETMGRLVSDWTYEAAEKLAKDNKIEDTEELYEAIDEYLCDELESALCFKVERGEDGLRVSGVPYTQLP